LKITFFTTVDETLGSERKITRADIKITNTDDDPIGFNSVSWFVGGTQFWNQPFWDYTPFVQFRNRAYQVESIVYYIINDELLEVVKVVDFEIRNGVLEIIE